VDNGLQLNNKKEMKMNELDKLQTEMRELMDKGDDVSWTKAMELKKEVDKLIEKRFDFA
jgi:ElaB/YqjD/DUF883 family membrane-anchored ribosome-binding protein